LQDDYKLTPKLTLNLGLRYEFEGGLTDRFDAITNFDPFLKTQVGSVPVTGGLIFPGANGLDRGHRDYLPFSVRQANTVTQLQQSVPNPFFGAIKVGGLSNANVQRQTLLDTYPYYVGASGLDSWASSSYHAMTLKVERRFTTGFSLLAAYTWSKAIDDNVGNGLNAFVDGGNDGVQDWDNLRAERAVSSNNLPHRLVLTSLYDLPFGKSGPGFVRAVIGGWQINGILTLQSGTAIGVTTGAGNPLFAGSRPNLIGDPNPGDARTIDNWLNRAAFAVAAERTPGTAPRNLPNYQTDGLATLDFALHKNFAIYEKLKLQFRAEAFNLTNTPTFGNPGTGFGAGNFGVITNTVTLPRQVQLGLKLLF